MSAESKALREQRGPICKLMTDLVAAAAKEGRSLNEEERAKFDQMDKDQGDLLSRYTDMEKVESINVQRNEIYNVPGAIHPDDAVRTERGKITRRDRAMALAAWGSPPTRRHKEHVAAAEKCEVDLDAREMNWRLWDRQPTHPTHLITRATTPLSSTASALGGALVANEPIRALEEVLLTYGGMRAMANVIRTGTGGTLPWPRVDDTGTAAAVLAENTFADVGDVPFASVSLLAWKYSSKVVLVSIEMMQDSSTNLPALLGSLLGTRIGRGTNEDMTNGAGTSGPLGAVTSAIAGTTTSDVNAFTYANLVTQVHTVDPAYRNPASPNVGWMMADDTLRYTKTLADSTGRPLWLPSMIVGEPDRLLGYRYVVNQDCTQIASATTGAGARKIMLFGDFSKFIIRDVMDINLVRFNERYMDYGQVGFLAFSRHDSRNIGSTAAATAPIKYMISKATA